MRREWQYLGTVEDWAAAQRLVWADLDRLVDGTPADWDNAAAMRARGINPDDWPDVLEAFTLEQARRFHAVVEQALAVEARR